MKTRFSYGAVAIVFAILFIASVNAFGQGRPGGAGGGRPAGAGGGAGGMGGGRPAGVGQPGGGMGGVDRGLGTASERSRGRSDDGLGNASTRSNGRSDAGLDRARANGAPENGSNELRRYSGISKKLDTTPEALRASYEAALVGNPDLKWGQFVAANVVADNLNGRYPNITSAAILEGLANGDSLGQTLEDLGLGEEQAEEVEKAAKREIKESKKRDN
jgi:hypothetical protein